MYFDIGGTGAPWRGCSAREPSAKLLECASITSNDEAGLPYPRYDEVGRGGVVCTVPWITEAFLVFSVVIFIPALSSQRMHD